MRDDQLTKMFLGPVVGAGGFTSADGDLPILGTADAGNAAFLVTGDKDLLDVRVYAETKIVTPRELWEWLRTR